MYLQGVHLIVRHHLHQAVEIGEGHELTTHIYHSATNGVGWRICNGSAGERFTLYLQLLQCLNTPQYALLGLSLYGYAFWIDDELVSFLAQFLIVTKLKAYRAALT